MKIRKRVGSNANTAELFYSNLYSVEITTNIKSLAIHHNNYILICQTKRLVDIILHFRQLFKTLQFISGV